MSKLYAIIGRDAPIAVTVRTEKMKEHLAHIEATMDDVVVAGPMRDEAGATIGSLLVLKADSEADARAKFERDPYFAAGVWSETTIQEFKAVAGAWVGGKTW